MATLILPSYAKLRELRLGVDAPGDDGFRPLNKKRAVGPRIGEIWAGEALFAGLNRAQIAALGAFFASCDGRVNAFGLPLAAGFASLTSALTLTLAAATTAGQDYLDFGASAISPGTLLTVGSIDSATFQLFEVVAAKSSAAHYVSPRVRLPFASGAAVTIGTVSGKFKLDRDAIEGWQSNASNGTMSVPILEAL